MSMLHDIDLAMRSHPERSEGPPHRLERLHNSCWHDEPADERSLGRGDDPGI